MNKSWFSDGGICSNFPIHFFDSWLPTRPTFGLNLTSMPDYMPEDKPREPVFLPRPNERGLLQPEWKEFKGLVGFAMAIFHSAQNYRDNMQSRLPSYLERIVQIRLEEDEGGLNLDMEPTTITKIDGVGRTAGEKLLTDFNFDQHRWVRLLVLMEQLELHLNKMEPALGSTATENLLRSQREEDFPYKKGSKDWCQKAEGRIEGLRGFIESWTPPNDAGETPPSWYFFHAISTAEP